METGYFAIFYSYVATTFEMINSIVFKQFSKMNTSLVNTTTSVTFLNTFLGFKIRKLHV